VVIGAACAYNRLDGKPFDEHDSALLAALGEQVAVGLDRATMLEETRRNERELAEKNRELLRVTKLKDEFLANMSHELRTPLNAIIGFSELLLMPGDSALDEQQQDFLESIARNGRHLLGLINNILDLSKIEAGRMTVHLTRVDLRESIQGAVTDTGSLRTAKRQTVTVDVGTEPLFVVADPYRVRQVLFNLSPMLRSSHRGGTVSLRACGLPCRCRSRPIERGSAPPGQPRRGLGVGTGQRDRHQRRPHEQAVQVFRQVDASASRRSKGADWAWRSANSS
jgi:K+-sensing histidine kinase KdpD